MNFESSFGQGVKHFEILMYSSSIGKVETTICQVICMAHVTSHVPFRHGVSGAAIIVIQATRKKKK